MKITIKFKGNEYDITKFVEMGSLQIRKTIDGTFDSGSFFISRIKADEYEGIDMSRPIPRYCDCAIESSGQTIYMLISESEVVSIRGLYQHSVTLISRSKILQMRPLPDMTLTQHSQSTSLLRSSTNNNTNAADVIELKAGTWEFPTDGADHYFRPNVAPYSGVKLTAADKALTFDTETDENDFINGLTLKQAGTEYNITFSTKAYNPQVNFEAKTIFFVTYAWAMHADTTLIVDMYINGVKNREIARRNIVGATPKYESTAGVTAPRREIAINAQMIDEVVKYTPTVANTVVSFRARVEGQYFIHPKALQPDEWQDDILFLTDTKVYVSTAGGAPFGYTKADELVDKVISLSEYDYTLSGNGRSRLQNIAAPEITFNSYDAWKAHLYIGSALGAIPRLKYNGTTDEIHYDFYDDLELQGARDFLNIQERKMRNSLEGYASAFELNAENVLKNNKGGYYPSIGGFAGVRAEGRGHTKITTDNLSFHTPFPIDRVYKVIVTGVEVKNANNETVYPSTKEWDITDRVLPKEHYDILPTQADYSDSARRANAFNINNTIYYEQGQPDIKGLSATGEREPVFFPDEGKANRAIREIVYCMAAMETTNELKTLHDEGKVEEDELIGVYIEYEPYIATRARIYKEDQSGFEKPIVEFFNESARVNDAYALGAYAQGEINRSSNTILEVKGICRLSQVPELGSKNSDGYILTEYQLNFIKGNDELGVDERVAYYGKYSRDFTVISEFTARKSDYRIWEVPKTNTVVSNRRLTRKVYLSPTPLSAPAGYAGHGLFLAQSSTLLGTAPVAAIFEPDSQPGKKFILNVDNSAYGKTVRCTVRAEDNYSVGSRRQKLSREKDGKTIDELYQRDCKYTNDFGQMSKFSLAFKWSINVSSGNQNQLKAELRELYPETTVALTNTSYVYPKLNNVEYIKDAREIFSFSIDTVFLSGDTENIYIYNGFARYHSLTRAIAQDGGILCALVSYVPSKSATFIDRSKILEHASVNAGDYYVEAQATEGGGQGFAYYNKETLELLLFTKTTGASYRVYLGKKE